MQFFSTRDTSRHVTSSEAIVQGLSEEGGLFVPESFPQVDARSVCQLDYPAMAAAVLDDWLRWRWFGEEKPHYTILRWGKEE